MGNVGGNVLTRSAVAWQRLQKAHMVVKIARIPRKIDARIMIFRRQNSEPENCEYCSSYLFIYFFYCNLELIVTHCLLVASIRYSSINLV